MDQVFRLGDAEAKRALDNLAECLDPGDTVVIRVTRISVDHLEIEVVPEGPIVVDDLSLGLLED